MSDLYYRENFHSDIICEFLNPAGSHNEGTTFLFAFIDFINTSFPTLPGISKKNYLNAKAEREYENIDILISDDVSKHCIIFENKINNASMRSSLNLSVNQQFMSKWTKDALLLCQVE